MAKCLICGRKLISEKSIACGIGSECRSKIHKTSSTSKRAGIWKRRIQRTIGFARGEFEIGNTRYSRVENQFPVLWQDGKRFYKEEYMEAWLNTYKQIITKNEVDDKMYVLLRSGKSIEEIIALTLDNTEEV